MNLHGDLVSKNKKIREKAWTQLYKESYPQLQYFTRNGIIKEEDQADLWQDIALDLYIKLDQGHPIQNLKAYLFRVIKNQSWKLFTERKKGIDKMEDYQEFLAIVPDELLVKKYQLVLEIAEDVFEDMLKEDSIRNCVQIIRARFFDKIKDEELAPELGLAQDYIRVRRHKICLPYFLKQIENHPKYPELFD